MKKLIGIAFLMALATTLSAQPSQWEFNFGPRFWGPTIAGRYMLQPPSADAVETSITGLISGAWETVGYYRLSDGSEFSVPADGTDASVASYNRVDTRWQLGLQQGIVPRHDTTADLAVAFMLYRGQYDYPFENDSSLFFSSGLPETAGGLLGSIVAGVAASTVATDDVTRLMHGASAEFATEWGPGFLHNQLVGSADYTRLTLQGTDFLPLFTLDPVDGKNRFSSYLASFAVVDWASGPEIPQAIRSSTGGRSPRWAPGGAVRGYSSGRFDATFKAVANTEVRANLPAIVLAGIVPGLLVYTDAGYYLDATAKSPIASENSGYLLSSGAGLYVDLFDLAQIVFYTNYLWTDPSIDGDSWVPFTLGFGFQY